ncbi:MAG: class I SAM-dependent methyltransferase, partial [Chloroflexota bacterium]
MKILATLIYIIVQILFIPFAIVGAIFVFVRQTYTSKRLGVSGTAIEIINGRWTMDLFGIREDKASGQLAWALPNNSLIGMWMALFPLWLRHKISGDLWLYPTVKARGKEGLANLVINRTLYFDEVINRAVGHTEQFVTMGAGFDTRSYGVFKEAQWKCFELDQEKTQNLKIEQLKHADIDADHVTFVTVDFQTESWSDKLKAAGYDPSKKTIFLWEGVTLYISEQDVRHTLRELKVNAP